jgi:hypothetical protein
MEYMSKYLVSADTMLNLRDTPLYAGNRRGAPRNRDLAQGISFILPCRRGDHLTGSS